MGYVIIKQAPDRDEYVLWSDFTERPIAVGTRAEMIPYVEKVDPPQETPGGTGARFDRADRQGSSMIPYAHGWWDDEALIYEQRGYLSRQHLAEACRLRLAGRESEVWDLMTPFEDETEVRRD